MANKFNGFLDSVAGSALNPKGNLADYQHASRLYTDNNHALAPKTKFLYHVFLILIRQQQESFHEWLLTVQKLLMK